MHNIAMKAVLIAATAGSMLAAVPADAGPSRIELLAERHFRADHHQAGTRETHHGGYRQQRRADHGARHHRKSRHHAGHDRQRHYANARRYAANAVRQARRARNFGYNANHPRWSLNFQRHFEWALGTDAYKLEREYRKRARKLRELQRHADYRYGYDGYGYGH